MNTIRKANYTAHSVTGGLCYPFLHSCSISQLAHRSHSTEHKPIGAVIIILKTEEAYSERSPDSAVLKLVMNKSALLSLGTLKLYHRANRSDEQSLVFLPFTTRVTPGGLIPIGSGHHQTSLGHPTETSMVWQSRSETVGRFSAGNANLRQRMGTSDIER